MTHDDLLTRYNVDKDKLSSLYNCIVSFLEEKSVKVSYANLEPVVETDIYEVEEPVRDEDKHHESCVSDGGEVFLHEDLEEVGGIYGRTHDLLHVGCGHVWQWNSDETGGLKFYGDNAWKIASIFFLGKPEEEIKLVRDYEREAGILAMSHLKSILRKNSFGDEFSSSCIRLVNDYIQSDLKYIIDYYRTGKVENFFEKWQFATEPLPGIDVSFKIEPKKRMNKCISLISLR